MVMVAMVVVAAAMVVAGADCAAAAHLAAGLLGKRGSAGEHSDQRKKECNGGRTHDFRLHPPGAKRVTSCYPAMTLAASAASRWSSPPSS
jgi:hypothetical protein